MIFMDIESDEQFQKLESRIRDLEHIVEQLCPHKEIVEERPIKSMTNGKLLINSHCKLCKRWISQKEVV